MIRAVGAIGAVGLVGTGAAGGQQRDPLARHIVGVEPGRAAVARDRAAAVYRVLDFGDVGQAVSGWYTEDALVALSNNPNVRYVEAEGVMEAIGHTTDEESGDPTTEQVLPWGIDRVDAEVAHHEGETASGSSVAIIDTGIDPNHETLAENVAGGTAFVSCEGDCATDWDDDHGHGTHCGGIANADDNGVGVVGTSTASDLYAVKVLDGDGGGTYSDVAAGIEWTADQGIHVGSLSLGGDHSQTVQDACRYAYGNGTLLVAAAGNDGAHPVFSTVSYPAAYDEVMAISATDSTDSIASFSSRGEEVELAAPGVDVLSSLPGDDYDRWDGTSMACPHVSGAGAQLMEHGLSNTDARGTLDDTAEDVGLDSTEQGNGLVDVAAALGFDSSDDLDDNATPSCSIAHPGDGDTVAGTVTIQVAASDEEDDDTNLAVEVSIDGGSWLGATYSSDSGYYEYDWDTTAEDDGDHTIQARATDSDGATTESGQITVTVDNSGDGGTAPAIDQFDLTDTSNPRWARVEVDWAVSDDDGNLDAVTSVLNDGVDSETSSVSGSADSGTHELRERDGHGEADVTLTVTDTDGNQTSDTQTITLG